MPTINFQEEFSSKIPALTLLTTLGYQFGPKQILTGVSYAEETVQLNLVN